MQKKNVQAPIKSHQNDSRRSSCPASKDKPKKKDFLTYQKKGSAQISRIPGDKLKRASEAISEREGNHLYSEIQKAHTNLPKPEEHPTLQDEGEGYHSDITPRSKDIEHEQLEQNFQDIPPIPHEEQTGTTKPQSMQSKSVERSSKIFTESDEEKEDDRETEKKPDVEYPMDIRIEDLPTELERFSHNRIPSTQGGRTFNIDQAPLTGPDLNASHSSKSTVLLAESPRGSGGKSREHQMTQETEGSADTKEPEIQESFEIKPPKSLTTEATRVIDNVVAHDGPLIQPKPQEVTHANSMSMKNKINLEIYLKVENLLYVIKESIMSGKPIFQFCRDYIEVAPKIDRENFEKILTTEQERKLVKSSFLVKRLGIILMLYFTVENTPNEKALFQLKSLINAIHQNFIIVGYLISLKLKDKSKANVWTARLMELLEHDSSANFTKNENLDKLAYNNTNICNIMKNLIVSMRNKEILYAFNSIVIQLDRISIKEAYTRLLKSFSVFMSEKELRSQVTQYAPKKPVESKVQQLLKVEKEKKKDELAFLPKLVKGGVESQYTLVVDLDETLVHYAELPGKLNELRVRPYVAHFLTEVSKYYEIVVFTAAMQEYADWVLDNIDKEHCVTHRLYRQHASPDGYNFVKDLSKLGRDMARIMIVDNLAENFRLQPDNGIYIKPWYDDPEDTALLELTPLLVEIARKKVTDVRVALRRFRDQMIENIEKGFENPHLNLQLD